MEAPLLTGDLVKENSDLKSIQGWTVKGFDHVANEYMTSFDFVHLGTKEKLTGTQAELMRHANLSAALVNGMVLGKINHGGGWTLNEKEHLFPRIRQMPNGSWQTPEESWHNNSTTKSLLAWALADEIIETHAALKLIKPDVGAKAVMRSMGIFEHTAERSVTSVIRYFTDWDIKPKDLRIWLEFAQIYKQENEIPDNKFKGTLVDARSREHPETEERKLKVLQMTQSGIGPVQIAEHLNVSRATVQKAKKKLKEEGKL